MVLYNMSVAGKMLYNKFSRLRKCCTTSTICCELVRWWCPLVVLYNMSVAGFRVVEFGPKRVRLSCELMIISSSLLSLAGFTSVFSTFSLTLCGITGVSHLVGPTDQCSYLNILLAC